MLPEPTLNFTLPSIHDDTVLDCRVYHSHALSPVPNAPPWRRHAAIVAHPYAPMGGSYDDPIVDSVAEALLRAGYLVGTFNFRGAGHSAGRTSWTAKAERNDYMSFIGFMVHYIHFLDPYRPAPDASSPPTSSPAPDLSSRDERDQPILLAAGYSYGAMVTSQLPPLPQILSRFAAPPAISAAADIRLRAEHLAAQQNSFLAEARASRNAMPPTRRALRVGGDEGDQRRSGEHHRRSHSPHHTEDKLRRGVSELLAKTRARRSRSHSRQRSVEAAAVGGDEAGSPRKHHAGREHQHGHSHSHSHSHSSDEQAVLLPRIADLTSVRPAYALVSPLQGIVNHLTTMSFVPPWARHRGHEPARVPSASPAGDVNWIEDAGEAAEAKLATCPTLAVFGDRDGFVAIGKLRAWGARLDARPGSKFRGVEVTGAGHTWQEEGTLSALVGAVDEFARGLLKAA
ncbi:hypothetical protein D7B24_003089 [Verticillium nonalfalfae]|uniref:Xaa-Pro dipeptidyl-peptidase-like domain-containing protein n=1 Tax=Verticillium nonalfalfae TaxID=1051616 RepID=A0A3M9Y0M7_9PEZI|nr:uncharacterized protein D7B24_003089 [Verticillium nonalfalfae]RNJ52690.1 hypothetical protein D7B24_003089 [Verticillium nonalfalfae]